jgi:hypothetical protein
VDTIRGNIGEATEAVFRRTFLKRPRYQKGFFSRLKRKSGPDVWMYRWREIGPKGEARMRKQVIGTLQQYPSKTAA